MEPAHPQGEPRHRMGLSWSKSGTFLAGFFVVACAIYDESLLTKGTPATQGPSTVFGATGWGIGAGGAGPVAGTGSGRGGASEGGASGSGGKGESGSGGNGGTS